MYHKHPVPHILLLYVGFQDGISRRFRRFGSSGNGQQPVLLLHHNQTVILIHEAQFGVVQLHRSLSASYRHFVARLQGGVKLRHHHAIDRHQPVLQPSLGIRPCRAYRTRKKRQEIRRAADGIFGFFLFHTSSDLRLTISRYRLQPMKLPTTNIPYKSNIRPTFAAQKSNGTVK